ncbi:MAG: ShlB/FhaC/HecB family hemolysin secretion/activation protein [Acidiferrobacter sp.]
MTPKALSLLVSFRVLSLAVGLSLVPFCAIAATPPSIGQIMQPVPSTTPTAPVLKAPIITTPSVVSPGVVTPSRSFRVRTIIVTGNTILTKAQLAAFLKPYEGKTTTLSGLERLAQRLATRYHQAGYPFTTVYVPAQTLRNGVVHLTVLEARYGVVRMINHSAVHTNLIDATISPVHTGALIATAPLDQSLLLLSAIPGVVVSPATLSPGVLVGTANLTVTARPTAPVTGNVSVNNYGNNATGRQEFQGGVAINNLFGVGDVLTAQGLVSVTGGLAYGGIGYSALVDGIGTRVGINVSDLSYRLGGAFTALGARGGAQSVGITASQPLYLTPQAALYTGLTLSREVLEDNVTTDSLYDHRHIDSATLSLYGNEQDALFGSAGLTNATVSYTVGNLAFTNPAAQAADAAGAHTQGTFSKVDIQATRLQSLPYATTLAFAINGQQAFNNLDSAEGFVLGGPTALPGYPEGDAIADSGVSVTEALHHALPRIPAIPGLFRAALFADQGALAFNHTLYAGSGPNHGELADAGFAISWAPTPNLTSRVEVAWRTHASAAVLPVSSPVMVWWNVGWQG